MYGAVLRAQFESAKVDRSPGEGKCSEVAYIVAIALWFFGPRGLRSADPLAAPQQALQPRQQNRKIKRLGQIIVRARGESFEHVFRAPARRQHQYGNIVARGSQLRDHAEPVFPRQHDVEHDGVKLFFLLQQLVSRRSPIAHHFRRIPFGFEIEAQSLRQVRFILHYQNPAHGFDLGVTVRESIRGSSITTVVPRPSPSLTANAVPPCFLAMDFTMNSPRPVPFTCASDRLATRWKRLKIRLRLSDEMPTPWSCTRRTTRFSSGVSRRTCTST